MESGKFGTSPPLVAAFCICSLFIFVHSTASPAMPTGFAPERAPYREVIGAVGPVAGPAPKMSFLAVQNGVQMQDGGQNAKQEVKREQKLIKKEEKEEKKEKTHIKSEESNLKKEEKMLKQQQDAANRGDIKTFAKLDRKIENLVKAERRDASIADKVVKDERAHEAELDDLFKSWATSVKHPGSKWGGKHDTVISQQRKVEQRLAQLEQRNSKAENTQVAFLEKLQSSSNVFRNGQEQPQGFEAL